MASYGNGLRRPPWRDVDRSRALRSFQQIPATPPRPACSTATAAADSRQGAWDVLPGPGPQWVTVLQPQHLHSATQDVLFLRPADGTLATLHPSLLPADITCSAVDAVSGSASVFLGTRDGRILRLHVPRLEGASSERVGQGDTWLVRATAVYPGRPAQAADGTAVQEFQQAWPACRRYGRVSRLWCLSHSTSSGNGRPVGDDDDDGVSMATESSESEESGTEQEDEEDSGHEAMGGEAFRARDANGPWVESGLRHGPGVWVHAALRSRDVWAAERLPRVAAEQARLAAVLRTLTCCRGHGKDSPVLQQLQPATIALQAAGATAASSVGMVLAHAGRLVTPAAMIPVLPEAAAAWRVPLHRVRGTLRRHAVRAMPLLLAQVEGDAPVEELRARCRLPTQAWMQARPAMDRRDVSGGQLAAWGWGRVAACSDAASWLAGHPQAGTFPQPRLLLLSSTAWDRSHPAQPRFRHDTGEALELDVTHRGRMLGQDPVAFHDAAAPLDDALLQHRSMWLFWEPRLHVAPPAHGARPALYPLLNVLRRNAKAMVLGVTPQAPGAGAWTPALGAGATPAVPSTGMAVAVAASEGYGTHATIAAGAATAPLLGYAALGAPASVPPWKPETCQVPPDMHGGVAKAQRFRVLAATALEAGIYMTLDTRMVLVLEVPGLCSMPLVLGAWLRRLVAQKPEALTPRALQAVQDDREALLAAPDLDAHLAAWGSPALHRLPWLGRLPDGRLCQHVLLQLWRTLLVVQTVCAVQPGTAPGTLHPACHGSGLPELRLVAAYCASPHCRITDLRHCPAAAGPVDACATSAASQAFELQHSYLGAWVWTEVPWPSMRAAEGPPPLPIMYVWSMWHAAAPWEMRVPPSMVLRLWRSPWASRPHLAAWLQQWAHRAVRIMPILHVGSPAAPCCDPLAAPVPAKPQVAGTAAEATAASPRPRRRPRSASMASAASCRSSTSASCCSHVSVSHRRVSLDYNTGDDEDSTLTRDSSCSCSSESEDESAGSEHASGGDSEGAWSEGEGEASAHAGTIPNPEPARGAMWWLQRPRAGAGQLCWERRITLLLSTDAGRLVHMEAGTPAFRALWPTTLLCERPLSLSTFVVIAPAPPTQPAASVLHATPRKRQRIAVPAAASTSVPWGKALQGEGAELSAVLAVAGRATRHNASTVIQPASA